MTVSHLFYDFGMTEAGVSYDAYLRDPSIKLGYNINDIGFKELMNTVNLGTKATFSYQPVDDDCRKYLAIKRGKKPSAMKDHVLTPEEKKEATAALIAAENNQLLANRKTAGDASESGLIKFMQAF